MNNSPQHVSCFKIRIKQISLTLKECLILPDVIIIGKNERHPRNYDHRLLILNFIATYFISLIEPNEQLIDTIILITEPINNRE